LGTNQIENGVSYMGNKETLPNNNWYSDMSAPLSQNDISGKSEMYSLKEATWSAVGRYGGNIQMHLLEICSQM
jgi:hypothetical protein